MEEKKVKEAIKKCEERMAKTIQKIADTKNEWQVEFVNLRKELGL